MHDRVAQGLEEHTAKKVAQRLRHSDDTIDTLARDVGHTSEFASNRAFARPIGVGPARIAILGRVEARISNPRTDPDGLVDLAPLWDELHRHHLEVSEYRALVEDPGSSWASRLRWYRRLLAEGGSYVTAEDHRGRVIGYAMIAVEDGPDDTFEVMGGIAEVVTLIVAPGKRSSGLGRALLAAAEAIARDRGYDTVKIAVMSGNARAQSFYMSAGYSVAEHVLLRRLEL